MLIRRKKATKICFCFCSFSSFFSSGCNKVVYHYIIYYYYTVFEACFFNRQVFFPLIELPCKVSNLPKAEPFPVLITNFELNFNSSHFTIESSMELTKFDTTSLILKTRLDLKNAQVSFRRWFLADDAQNRRNENSFPFNGAVRRG